VLYRILLAPLLAVAFREAIAPGSIIFLVIINLGCAIFPHVLLVARLALVYMAVSHPFVLVEFRQRFDLPASEAFFHSETLFKFNDLNRVAPNQCFKKVLVKRDFIVEVIEATRGRQTVLAHHP
jgi:hypothetical protein